MLEEMRALFDVAGKPAYDRWGNFSARVLAPAVAAVNDYGTVEVKMTPQMAGKSVNAVRFDWKWKSVDEARVTEEENNRHSTARRKEPATTPDAPPLVSKFKTTEEETAWRKKMGLLT
jgi:plasmid replication initiation protein